MTEDHTKNVVTLTLNIVDAGREILIIQQIHLKSINMTIKHVTKGIQRIEDMDTPADFRQNVYTIRKITVNKGLRCQVKK